MTFATMNRHCNSSTSPLIGIAAVVAAAVTLSIAIWLPTQLAPTLARTTAPAVAAAPMAKPPSIPIPTVTPDLTIAVEGPAQVVTLPSIEVTATRPTKAAANRPWNVPAVYKQKS